LTEFAKRLFISSDLNLDADKFIIKPNFVSDAEANGEIRNDDFLYVGRLSAEKGIEVLLNVFRNMHLKLHIAGVGPLKQTVVNAAADSPNIIYHGLLSYTQVVEKLQTCSALIFPSVWY